MNYFLCLLSASIHWEVFIYFSKIKSIDLTCINSYRLWADVLLAASHDQIFTEHRENWHLQHSEVCAAVPKNINGSVKSRCLLRLLWWREEKTDCNPAMGTLPHPNQSLLYLLSPEVTWDDLILTLSWRKRLQAFELVTHKLWSLRAENSEINFCDGFHSWSTIWLSRFVSVAASEGWALKDLGESISTLWWCAPSAQLLLLQCANHRHSFLCFYFGCWYNVGGVLSVFPIFTSLLPLFSIGTWSAVPPDAVPLLRVELEEIFSK